MEIVAIVTLAGAGIGVIAGTVQVVDYLEKKRRGGPPTPPVPAPRPPPPAPDPPPPVPTLPQGTVTFLLTDIERSSKIWEAHPQEMRAALARHHELLRLAVSGHGGHAFKDTGDGLLAAFGSAPEALAAALDAQRALNGEAWPPGAELKARLALHTGAAEERGGDYHGPAINRLARLLSAGHGGQTLLSQTTADLVREQMPAGGSLRELGVVRLRDLARSEQVFQLLHSDLPDVFPPLRSLETLPNNLPPTVSSFVGRERVMGEVTELLGRTRLLTLVGIGGTGKTRLSLEVAAALLVGDGDGVWLTELAPVTDPALVPQAVADVLGVKEQAGTPLRETLLRCLRPKRLLLILDNCEHLTGACASLAAEILHACPQVLLLASSREPLGVSGEQVYRVPSLSLPEAGGVPTAASLSGCESSALFLARAASVRAGFSVTDADAPALASICRRLDGIPLALELAAARVGALSVGEINSRLNDRFRLLTGGSRTALPRQRTLQALVDWSYDLLTEAEKATLCRLSVFTGGWSVDAAEVVCAGGAVASGDVLDVLSGLVDKSLVVAEASGSGTRYRLLETVRQYARDRLVERGEAAGVQDRAAGWFLGLAEAAEPQLMGPEQAAWLSRLETEHDNLRSSLAWCEERPEAGEAGLRLAGALWRFWYVRGYFSEGRQWLERALAGGQEGAGVGEAAAARAKALDGAGALAHIQGDYGAARTLQEESVTIHRRLGDERGIAYSLNGLGHVTHAQGDYGAARTLFEECLTIRRRLGDERGVAYSLHGLGNVARSQSDFGAARTLQEESVTIWRRLGDERGIALSLHGLGNVAINHGDYGAARTLFEEGLTICRRLGDEAGIAYSLNGLGDVAQAQGDYGAARTLQEEGLTIHRRLGNERGAADSLLNLGCVAEKQGDSAEARVLFRKSLTIHRQIGDKEGMAHDLEGLAVVAHGQSQPARAARLLGATEALREALGAPLPSAKQEKVTGRVASVREALGEEAFATAWDAGRAMTLEQAFAFSSGEAAEGPLQEPEV